MSLALRPAPLQPDEVQPGEMRPLADHRAVGDDVGDDAGEPADHRAAAEAHELVHRRRARRGSRSPRRRTWPPRVALLAMMTWLPMMQSCATWVAIMKRLSSPTRVTPPPPSVPGFIVTCSRMRLRAPMTSSTALAAELQVLRDVADRGEGEDRRSSSPMRVPPGHRDVAVQHDPRPEHHLGADRRSRGRSGSRRRSRRRPRRRRSGGPRRWDRCAMGFSLSRSPLPGTGSSPRTRPRRRACRRPCASPRNFQILPRPRITVDVQLQRVAGLHHAGGTSRSRCS